LSKPVAFHEPLLLRHPFYHIFLTPKRFHIFLDGSATQQNAGNGMLVIIEITQRRMNPNHAEDKMALFKEDDQRAEEFDVRYQIIELQRNRISSRIMKNQKQII
jgi:hypothetical protein